MKTHQQCGAGMEGGLRILERAPRKFDRITKYNFTFHKVCLNGNYLNKASPHEGLVGF